MATQHAVPCCAGPDRLPHQHGHHRPDLPRVKSTQAERLQRLAMLTRVGCLDIPTEDYEVLRPDMALEDPMDLIGLMERVSLGHGNVLQQPALLEWVKTLVDLVEELTEAGWQRDAILQKLFKVSVELMRESRPGARGSWDTPMPEGMSRQLGVAVAAVLCWLEHPIMPPTVPQINQLFLSGSWLQKHASTLQRLDRGCTSIMSAIAGSILAVSRANFFAKVASQRQLDTDTMTTAGSSHSSGAKCESRLCAICRPTATSCASPACSPKVMSSPEPVCGISPCDDDDDGYMHPSVDTGLLHAFHWDLACAVPAGIMHAEVCPVVLVTAHHLEITDAGVQVAVQAPQKPWLQDSPPDLILVDIEDLWSDEWTDISYEMQQFLAREAHAHDLVMVTTAAIEAFFQTWEVMTVEEATILMAAGNDENEAQIDQLAASLPRGAQIQLYEHIAKRPGWPGCSPARTDQWTLAQHGMGGFTSRRLREESNAFICSCLSKQPRPVMALFAGRYVDSPQPLAHRFVAALRATASSTAARAPFKSAAMAAASGCPRAAAPTAPNSSKAPPPAGLRIHAPPAADALIARAPKQVPSPTKTAAAPGNKVTATIQAASTSAAAQSLVKAWSPSQSSLLGATQAGSGAVQTDKVPRKQLLDLGQIAGSVQYVQELLSLAQKRPAGALQLRVIKGKVQIPCGADGQQLAQEAPTLPASLTQGGRSLRECFDVLQAAGAISIKPTQGCGGSYTVDLAGTAQFIRKQQQQ